MGEKDMFEEKPELNEDKKFLLTVYEYLLERNDGAPINKVQSEYYMGFNRAFRIIQIFIDLGMIEIVDGKKVLTKSKEEASTILNNY